MSLISLLLLAAHPAPAPQADRPFRFVVAGDGRSHTRPASGAPGEEGINLPVLRELTQAFLAEGPRFMMWSGDLVMGYTDGPTFRSQLLVWRKEMMDPLMAKGIVVLPCRGNHDASSEHGKDVWNEVFSGKYVLPQNGPAAEKNLTYYYKDGNVLAIMLDHYTPHTFEEDGRTVTYDTETVNQEWLDGVLKKQKRPFIFAMGHEAAFVAGNHMDTLSVHPRQRDAFVKSLTNAGSKLYLAGHDHFFDHLVATPTKGGKEIQQVVAGTAGAPTYPDAQYDPVTKRYRPSEPNWNRTRLKHYPEPYRPGEFEYGYVVVDVVGHTAKVTYKERTGPGKFEPVYSFTVGDSTRR